MSGLTIECKYSCFQCGVYRQSVIVPARGTEDVKVWLDQAAYIMSRDHDKRSPGCRITKLDEVMIPMPDATSKVGGVPTNS